MIPQTPEIMQSPLCYEGDTRTIPEDTPLGTNQLSYKLGFPPITSINVKAGGIAPSRVDMNAALKLLSIHTYFLQSGNKYKYSNLLDYEIGSTVLGSDNALYYCIQANGATSPNTVQDPTTSSDYWTKIIYSNGLINLPIGFIYIQLRNQSTPDELFGTSGTWQDISATYAGEFFRAVGGNSASFGVTQAEGIPNITGTFALSWGMLYSDGNGLSGAFTSDGQLATPNPGSTTNRNGVKFNASNSNSIYGASTHVTPYNSAVRIWKKIS